jgi:hypothetical protein
MPMVTPEAPAAAITLDDRRIATPLGADILSKAPPAPARDRRAVTAVTTSDPAPEPADTEGRLWSVRGIVAIIALAAIVGAASALIIYQLAR